MHSTAPDPQPSPARVFVPVRRSRFAVVLRTYVDPLGQRTGVAFTRLDSLLEVLGENVEFVELGVRAYRALLAASGTEVVCFDPRMSAARPVVLDPSAEVFPPLTPAAVPAGNKPGVGHARTLRFEGFAA